MIINSILFMFEDGKTIQFSPRYTSNGEGVKLSGWSVTVWADAGPCYQEPMLEDFHQTIVAPDSGVAEHYYKLTNEPG